MKKKQVFVRVKKKSNWIFCSNLTIACIGSDWSNVYWQLTDILMSNIQTEIYTSAMYMPCAFKLVGCRWRHINYEIHLQAKPIHYTLLLTPHFSTPMRFLHSFSSSIWNLHSSRKADAYEDAKINTYYLISKLLNNNNCSDYVFVYCVFLCAFIMLCSANRVPKCYKNVCIYLCRYLFLLFCWRFHSSSCFHKMVT